MKLAFCLFRYFQFGGLQRDFLRIADECLKRGHTIDVYTMRWEGPRDPRLPVTEIPVRGLQNHTRSKAFVKHLKPVLADKNYDLVVGFNKMPGLHVYYAADTCFQAKMRTWQRLLPRYRHLLAFEKAVFAKPSKTEILLISKKQQPEFMRYYGTEASRFHLLPPGIARDRMAPANAEEIRRAVRDEFAIRQDDFLTLMVGSGFRTKGLDRSLKGIAALPETLKKRTRLFVIGKDNPTRFERQARASGLSEQVFFMGGREDVSRFLLAADVLLHPAYHENTGTVLLEAVVSGLPVLTTDVCGYADYIQQAGAGIVLASPFQQNSFNQTLHAMLLSPERETWRQNGITFSKTADIYDMPKRAVDVIESLYADTRS
ncbi:MAG TPA: glycosyltransferase family 4 protein [Gammaproteobacteria bacterium]|nr:glycosyltransferase family 4 protein [Gammaproteobacteria bacterium]